MAANGIDSPIWVQDERQTGLALPGTFSAAGGAFSVDATGRVSYAGTRTATVAASAAINTVETVISTPVVLTPGTSLRIGSRIVFQAFGTCTATVANNSTFTVRAGILGTTGDASVVAVGGANLTSAAAGTNVPFSVRIEFTVQTLGAGGTGFGSMSVLNQGVTGLSTAAVNIVPFTTATLATTTATNVELTYLSAAATTTCTFQNVTAEITL